MKIAAVLIVLLLARPTFAERPNIDTVSLFGIRPSLASSSVHSLSIFDTIFWNFGTGMLQTKGTMYNRQGDFRVAIQNGKIQQVSFVTLTHNKSETDRIFAEIISNVEQDYGKPDIRTPREIKWEGLEQFFAIRSGTDDNSISIVISQFDKK